MQIWKVAAVLLTVNFHGQSAFAQLPAFPGAEGAAKYVTGGRGGDIYKVTNLNDSGAGSLRFGIQNAPTSGRTIVFDVAGTIHLNSSLDFNGRSNITVAGQTAPGGGITLSGRSLRINNADNVVVQFLRIRPGAAASNADGLWVQASTNIMVDHVTTAWSTDESLSVTHNSDIVTVQWSTMFQGLLGHSFGSLINDGRYTFHHNLYAHNRSRNPRAQDERSDLTLDWVNNVIYNPGDRFGYSGSDKYDMNMVGNYGIKGPDSQNSTPANYMMRTTGSSQARFFVDGNYMDIVRDSYVNGVNLEGTNLFHPSDSQGQSDTNLMSGRFDGGGVLHEVTTHTAERAYIHALTRTGAVNYRDAHDRDMIRSIINQQPGHISHESEWGASPVLPVGTPKVDSSGDGIPDDWAIARGLDPNTQHHQTLASSGYTYLEEYIHSATPSFAYAPASTVPHSISTAFGRGADAQVNENGGASAVSSGAGSGEAIALQWGGPTGTTNQTMLLRFDLSQLEPGSLDYARLELTAASEIIGSHTFKVWGLEHDAVGWDWDENTVEYANAPGLEFDGNSGTLGIDPRYTANGQLAATNNLPLPVPDDLLVLGEFTIGSTAPNEIVAFDDLNLAVFLNLAAFFESDEMAGLATIIVQKIGGGSAASFFSKEGDPENAPRLAVEGVVAAVAPTVLPGDFNNDGVVDAADYTIWRNHFGDETEDGINNAGDGQNGVDLADYEIWKQHFGSSNLGSGSLTRAPVPEPTTFGLFVSGLASVLAALARRRRWR